MGSKSNCFTLKITSATKVFLSDGINVISIFYVEDAIIVPLIGVIIKAEDSERYLNSYGKSTDIGLFIG